MITSGMIINKPSQLVVNPESLAPRKFRMEMVMINTAATSQESRSGELLAKDHGTVTQAGE